MPLRSAEFAPAMADGGRKSAAAYVKSQSMVSDMCQWGPGIKIRRAIVAVRAEYGERSRSHGG